MTRPPLTDRFESALAYAAAVHRRQTRKGTDVPYVAHLMAVTALVLEHGGDEDAAIAALLHDAVEDQGGAARLTEIRERFGSRVADIVEGCTDTATDPKPPWKGRKVRYLEHVRTAPPDVRLVSMADKLHNARAILRDYRLIGEELWSRFAGGRDGTLWYYQALVDAYRGGQASALLEELDRTVYELVTLAGDRRVGPDATPSPP